ncbi:MAG: hypothetical protein OTI34_07020 [Lewinella sp.]|nr:hypothetical protein [Lewinella sp.]
MIVSKINNATPATGYTGAGSIVSALGIHGGGLLSGLTCAKYGGRS